MDPLDLPPDYVTSAFNAYTKSYLFAHLGEKQYFRLMFWARDLEWRKHPETGELMLYSWDFDSFAMNKGSVI